MATIIETIKKYLELMGFSDYSVNLDEENKKIAIFVNEGEWLKERLPELMGDFENVIKLLAKKNGVEKIFIDLNNYRKERERLIVELAKAAARKALINKEEIKLPTMNAYERRLVHVELSTRPDVKTESIGEGPERHIIVKPL